MENKEKKYYSWGTPAPTEKVKDVTVAGTSVVDGKVAKIPKASNTTYGVVKVDNDTITANDGVIAATKYTAGENIVINGYEISAVVPEEVAIFKNNDLSADLVAAWEAGKCCIFEDDYGYRALIHSVDAGNVAYAVRFGNKNSTEKTLMGNHYFIRLNSTNISSNKTFCDVVLDTRKATTDMVGMVAPDGTTITINEYGVISATGGSKDYTLSTPLKIGTLGNKDLYEMYCKGTFTLSNIHSLSAVVDFSSEIEDDFDVLNIDTCLTSQFTSGGIDASDTISGDNAATKLADICGENFNSPLIFTSLFEKAVQDGELLGSMLAIEIKTTDESDDLTSFKDKVSYSVKLQYVLK